MKDYLKIGLLALLLFFPFLGGVHLFDWDEINFAECAREMLATGDWFRPQIDFEPFWEKPPLFIWMQAASMKIFGVGEFAARLPNAICGLLTLLLVYHLGKKLFDKCFGWLWALAWVGSLLPHLYFRSGIIDPWFNLLIFTGLYGFVRFRWQFFRLHEIRGFWAKYGWLIGGGWLIGLAVMTKGPVAYLIVVLTIAAYWARYKFRGKGYLRHILMMSVAVASVAALWFLAEIALHGSWFVREFLAYQMRLLTTPDSGHGGFFGYHFVVLLLGCFPASVFAIPNLWGDRQPEDELMESDTLCSCERCDFTTWMQILFWVVLILFSLVTTKIVHYSSLAYFPLTYLAALTVWRAHKFKQCFRSPSFLLPVLGTVIGLAAAALPYLGQNLHLLRPLFERDAFALENLNAQTCWVWWQSVPGILLAAASVAAGIFWWKKQAWRSAELIFPAGAMFTALTLIFFIRNIESITQGAAIEFYESKIGQDCYVKTVGFKSYAHLFYARKQPRTGDPTVDDFPNLSRGTVGKPVFFVAKCTNLGELRDLPGCHEMGRKNGFVFFERVER